MKINKSVSIRLGVIALAVTAFDKRQVPSGEPRAGELIKLIEAASGGISAGLAFDRLGG